MPPWRQLRNERRSVGSRLAKRFAKDAGTPVAGAHEAGELLSLGGVLLVESPLDGQDLLVKDSITAAPMKNSIATCPFSPVAIRWPNSSGSAIPPDRGADLIGERDRQRAGLAGRISNAVRYAALVRAEARKKTTTMIAMKESAVNPWENEHDAEHHRDGRRQRRLDRRDRVAVSNRREAAARARSRTPGAVRRRRRRSRLSTTPG
jgi:hypothetical protein